MRHHNSFEPMASRPTTNARRAWEEQANWRIAPTGSNIDEHAIVFKRNEAITAAYAEMYLRNPRIYKWAGMAALTSATVGRGMYIMHGLRQARLGSVIGLFPRDVAE